VERVQGRLLHAGLERGPRSSSQSL
jgi:hypothetical protein